MKAINIFAEYTGDTESVFIPGHVYLLHIHLGFRIIHAKALHQSTLQVIDGAEARYFSKRKFAKDWKIVPVEGHVHA